MRLLSLMLLVAMALPIGAIAQSSPKKNIVEELNWYWARFEANVQLKERLYVTTELHARGDFDKSYRIVNANVPRVSIYSEVLWNLYLGGGATYSSIPIYNPNAFVENKPDAVASQFRFHGFVRYQYLRKRYALHFRNQIEEWITQGSDSRVGPTGTVNVLVNKFNKTVKNRYRVQLDVHLWANEYGALVSANVSSEFWFDYNEDRIKFLNTWALAVLDHHRFGTGLTLRPTSYLWIDLNYNWWLMFTPNNQLNRWYFRHTHVLEVGARTFFPKLRWGRKWD